MTKKNLATTTQDSSLIDAKRLDSLYTHISGLVEHACQQVQRTVDTEMVKAYWQIGQAIVEEEQHGQQRAAYGKAILKELSLKLQSRYRQGFGIDTLEQCRKFYLIYQSVMGSSISDALRRKLADFPLQPMKCYVK